MLGFSFADFKNHRTSLLGLGLLGAIMVAPTLSYAQSGGTGGIEIEAEEGIEWLKNEQKYIARGNASATQDGVKVSADTLIAHYTADEDGGNQTINRMDASGRVHINQGPSDAYGDQAVYYMDKKVVVMVGKGLKLTSRGATITAKDSLEYWEERQVAVARGNATVKQEEKTLIAGVLIASIKADKNGKESVQRIDATDGVRVSTETEIISGQEGVYDVVRNFVVICGNVKITRGQNQLNGNCAEVDMNTGRSKLKGGKGKVKGLILPTQ